MRRVRNRANANGARDSFSSRLKQIIENRTESWSSYDARDALEIRSQARKKNHAFGSYYCHRCGYRG